MLRHAVAEKVVGEGMRHLGIESLAEHHLWTLRHEERQRWKGRDVVPEALPGTSGATGAVRVNKNGTHTSASVKVSDVAVWSCRREQCVRRHMILSVLPIMTRRDRHAIGTRQFAHSS